MTRTQQRFAMGRVYRDAIALAVVRGDRSVSTEHLALALLVDPESAPARALGVSLTTAREALEALDHQALTSIGIDGGFPAPTPAPRRPRRLRLTPAALAVFKTLRKHAKGERLGAQHVLLALLARQRPDLAAELFDALDVDRAEVRRRLQETS